MDFVLSEIDIMDVLPRDLLVDKFMLARGTKTRSIKLIQIGEKCPVLSFLYELQQKNLPEFKKIVNEPVAQFRRLTNLTSE